MIAAGIMWMSLVITPLAGAATGWFNDYIFLSTDAVGTGGTFSIGTFNTPAGTSLDGYDFGSVTTLRITGADMQYWSDTQDRQGGAYYWKIGSGGSANEVVWNQTGPSGNNYEGTISTDTNVAAGLSPGSYTLYVWAKSWNGQAGGDDYLSNSGANYAATFSVVPEPSSLSLLFGSSCVGAFYLMRRRRS